MYNKARTIALGVVCARDMNIGIHSRKRRSDPGSCAGFFHLFVTLVGIVPYSKESLKAFKQKKQVTSKDVLVVELDKREAHSPQLRVPTVSCRKTNG